MSGSVRTFRKLGMMICIASLGGTISADETKDRPKGPPVAPAVQPQLPPRGRRIAKPVIQPPVETVFQYPAPNPKEEAIEQTVAVEPVTEESLRSATLEEPVAEPAVTGLPPAQLRHQPGQPSPPNRLPQHLQRSTPSRSLAEQTGLDEVHDISFADQGRSGTRLATYGESRITPQDSAEMAAFVPWWQPRMQEALNNEAQLLPVTLDEVIFQALQHSHFLRAQSNLPLMSEQAIIEAAAEFDVSAFTQSRYTRTSEPIGNTLTAGPGRTRFRDNNWTHNAGVLKRTYSGGRVELAQRYGYQQNNSDFLIPNPQSTTQLALRFSQPLLRGKGKVYNSSLIVLASIDKNIAWHQFSRELQDHLVEVANGYWELYLQRAILLQRQRHFERATEILQELETRSDIDTARSQVVRAQSAVAARRSDLARAKAAVRNAQAQLRALVNMPELTGTGLELVPNEQPNPQFINVSLDDALVTALENRPEIDEAMQQLKSARVQVSVAQHELLPVLDVVTETYVSGLQSGTNVGDAWVDQFRVGEPSYSLGLEMEVPLYNRAAKARHRRKRLQLQWIVSRYQDTLATLTSEVEIVVRDVKTAYTEMVGKYHAMKATQAELEYLTARWQLLPGDDRSASFLLEDILNIQDRLVGHEFELARAQVAYTQALVDLKRATGTLLEAEEVSKTRACECGIPQLYLSKPAQYEDDAFYMDSGGQPLVEGVITEPIPSEPFPISPQDLPLPEAGPIDSRSPGQR